MMSRKAAFVAIAAVCLVTCFAGVAAADAPAGYHYRYFDEPVALGLDAGRVAVKIDAARDSAARELMFASQGLTQDDESGVAIPQWFMPKLAQDRLAKSDLSTVVADMANSGEFEFVSPVFLGAAGLPMIVTQDLLVGFDKDTSDADASRILAEHVEGEILDRNFSGLPGVYRVRASTRDGLEVLRMANELATLPETLFAQSDWIIRGTLCLIPDDPMFSQQWALQQASDEDMDVPEAWDLTTGDNSIVVAVLDTGIQQNHPDLHQIPGQDFTDHGTTGGGPYNDCDNHATSVAGCVSATINNGIGIAGVAPDCLVTSGKVGTTISFFGFCTPYLDMQSSYLTNALNWAVSIEADVTNCSFSAEVDAATTTAFNNAKANGIINVAATGNDGSTTISYPANLASTIAVGAVGASGTITSFSTTGTGISFVAPGEGILTTDRTGGDGYESGDYATVDGTSFSSPYTAGVAALVRSMDPTLTPDEVEDILNDSCVDKGTLGYDTTYGWGFLNAANAVQAVAITCALPGDMNSDTQIDGEDIQCFVECMISGTGAGCQCQCADTDGVSGLSMADITAFVNILLD